MRSYLSLPIMVAATAWSSSGRADGDQQHEQMSSDIVVTAPFQRNQTDVLSGTSVVAGDELTRDMRPTIGDTLARQPGVSATSFGPNASRPVLRGFQGERVRVLTDGIGSFDVSNTSVDHPVVINQLTAERIEVLRGPTALLFGSSAIGGVVNVIDDRIPRKVPSETVHLDALATYGSAASERSGGISLDVPLSSTLVAHVDGSYSKTNDLRTGGYLLARALRAQAAASPDSDIASLADLHGRLPNSAGRTWDVAGGLAYASDGANVGFAVSHYESLYGFPVRFSLDPAIEAEQARIDARQTRVDARAEFSLGDGFFDKARFRGGYADYKHSELEEDGAVGTRFLSQGWEGRLELVQAAHDGWQGAIGGQVLLRKLDIIGDEKFLPRSDTRQLGLFTLQSFDWGSLKAEVGARYEHAAVEADADALLGSPAYDRTYDAFSGSIGASYEFLPDIKFGVSLSHTERAPSAEELFADGPHAGTQAFEIGNPNFVKETSNGLELSFKAKGSGYSLALSGYQSWFDDFIYEDQTGAMEDGLPVFQSRQAKARYFGMEGEVTLKLADIGAFAINADALGDCTRATITAIGPAPRIPALRVMGGIEAQSDKFDGRVEVEHVDGQSRVALVESPTEGYTMVDASITLRPRGKDGGLSIILSANNIFDVDARRNVSFLKDYAPLAGRDIRVSARFTL